MEGGTAYITSCPCFTCAKNLSNSGIARAVFRVTEVDRDRKPELSIAMMKTSGIETVDFDWDLNDNAY
jgi:deoxycytidylate deaminase